ncbi:assimilatory sulfite reductase (NADPH) flavoprotein subunit [Staphylococcus saprophyticus]|uniref:assimilatory sulfite reductase (NADPH) flavoprotein subunit n=1 Tax=Staphylococcus saprophyticus TaxID=29385 RepID=UPI000E07FB41|nr:assimilatory sulfite reductase (NADPH) flavoprotein subunit [Staphylococcus saprophyticus]MDW4208649.1 assimilatory sulfite reductase (NADPH) flavoprotein subunit [Staphylococcus saprophyticus]MDW4226314.1 assimilatory sulfite reductase (NADPH) flavoprotein subunit [Staphylococcus saprophyticus]MDW4231360.1 assimilatory sulfite reductase (NADPH) flavoprotein subunit [Staphylococcus saprophyticus]MDW4245961.1 assimilatory sulfite reductase (NADPH) flavoprotein subunit [Staphylococcus saprophy
MQLNQTNTPFNEEQLALINQLLPMLTPEQQHWLSGYLLNPATTSVSDNKADIQENEAGITETETSTSTDQSVSEPVSASTEPLDVHVLYGTETGNAEEIAETFETKLKSQNLNVHLWDMDDFPRDSLPEVEHLFIICSTQGVGEPPINALDLYDYLHGDDAPQLDQVNFAVLALGDQDFPDFCQAGKDFDHILGQLGANRVADRVDCDFDYEETAEQWITNMLELLTQASSNTNEETPSVENEDVTIEEPQAPYSKSNPFQAEVLKNTILTQPEASREVRHLEISLEGYREAYEPGDSLVVIPQNDPVLVNQLIDALNWDAETPIQMNDSDSMRSLKEALTHDFEIAKLTPVLMKNAAELLGNPMLNANIQKSEWVQNYIYGKDVIDLIRDFTPVALEPNMLPQLLRKLPPREYSIASSNKINPNSVHITVRVVKYEAHRRERFGVCSVQLADRTSVGDKLPVYLKKNPNFKFPYDTETPVIMIGAGTGIAPYRAYLQERAYLNLKGEQWLIFGNQNYHHDFLYKDDLEQWLEEGVLSKLDLAFSRETENKIYVQHRIEENSAEFYKWIQAGATIYLCGNKDEMASGVHESLIKVLIKEGNMDETEAEAYLTEMIKNQRYQRDVY